MDTPTTVMAGLVPAIHAFDAWHEIRGCPAIRPGMTGDYLKLRVNRHGG
jgi:hypothetical protein